MGLFHQNCHFAFRLFAFSCLIVNGLMASPSLGADGLVLPADLYVTFESTNEFEQLGAVLNAPVGASYNSGVAIVSGYPGTGNGAEIRNGDELGFSTDRNIDPRKGSLSFDFKPNWNWADNQHHTLLDAGNFRVFKWYKSGATPQNVWVVLYFDASGVKHQVTMRTSGADNDLFGDGSTWKDQWHHVVVQWDVTGDEKYLYFNIDNKLGPNDDSSNGFNREVVAIDGIPALNDVLKIGHGSHGAAEGVFDNLLIGDIHPIFYAPMQDAASVAANNGVATQSPAYVAGRVGNAVSLLPGTGGSPDQTLAYSGVSGIIHNSGAVTIDFKPNWQWADNQYHQILDAGSLQIFKYYKSDADENILFAKLIHAELDGDGNPLYTQASIRTSGGDNNILHDDSLWQNQWRHIEVYWDATADVPALVLMVDGKRGDARTFVGSGVAPSASTIKVGHGSFGPGDGVFDELKIYNQPLWRTNGPASYIEVTRGNGVQEAHETIHNSPDAAPLDSSIEPGEQQIFYMASAFEGTYEGHVPTPDQVLNANDIDADYHIAQGEYEPLFFNLYTREKLEDAVLEVVNLVGPGGEAVSFPAKLYVVKNWWQAGTGPQKDGIPKYIPELLLKSDVDGDAANLETEEWSYDSLPSLVEADGAVHTFFDAETSKQFVYIVSIPRGAASGEYDATIRLTEGGFFRKDFHLIFVVDNISLLDANKEYLIYHPSTLTDSTSTRYVSSGVYAKELADIAAHGFTGVINYQDDESHADNMSAINSMLQQSQNAGLDRVIMLEHNDMNRSDIISLFANRGMEPWFYGVDEPNKPYEIDEHINLSVDIHADGGLVFTAISNDYANRLEDDPFDLSDPISVYFGGPGTDLPPGEDIQLDADVTGREPLDQANIAISDRDYFDGLAYGDETELRSRTYYWQSMQENPFVNRAYAGFYLWNTGLRGVAPFVYKAVRQNPYDDWDDFSSSAPIWRDHLTVYPSQDGPVPTIQWEALREGIDDVRYLQTWKFYYDQLVAVDSGSPLVAASANAVNNVLDHYRDRAFSVTTGAGASRAQQFQDDRAVIRQEILRLSDELDGLGCVHVQQPGVSYLIFQAEAGACIDLNGDSGTWKVESDPGQGATGIASPQVIRADMPVAYNSTPGGGEAFYNIEFTDPSTTQYYLYARVRAASAGSDSFFSPVELDAFDVADISRGFPSHDGRFHWMEVAGYTVVPGVLHTLRIGAREKNARIDAFVFHESSGLASSNAALLSSLVLQGYLILNQGDVSDYSTGREGGSTAIVTEQGAKLTLTGNGWVSIPLGGYTVTANTVIEFDYESTVQGEIQGIGFDNDNGNDASRTFRIYGTQSWGISAASSYTGSGVEHFKIRIGDFAGYPLGLVERLFFVNDQDNPGGAGDAVGIFSNIQVYEEDGDGA